MRVLITRPEREATTLATALGERGHAPVVAPLFRLDILHPPAGFADALAASQAVLLTSANGARALADANPQRAKPVFAVGDTTATEAEGLGFTTVTSAAGDAAALVGLVRQRLDAKAGPLIHVSGSDVAVDFAESLAPDGYDVRRFALYEAREEAVLPESARAALQARALDVATFFSPRAAATFARLVDDAKLGDMLQDVTAVAISPAALAPLADLPFKARVAAVRPTRQAVLDEIDRLAEAGVQGQASMSETSSSPSAPTPPPASPPLAAAEPAEPVGAIRRGIGVGGAFVTGIVAASLVLAVALISLPFWPEQIQALWRGKTMIAAPSQAIDLQAVRADASAAAAAAVEAARRDLNTRLDDLEKRVRAAAAAAAERPTSPDAALAELRSKVEALERRAASAAPSTAQPASPTSPSTAGDTEKELALLSREIAALRTSMQALDQSLATQKDEQARQREHTKSLADAIGARGPAEQKALIAARASAVIGVAARLSAALESGLPFAVDLGLLTPLVQGDAKLAEITASLQPYGASGVASRAILVAEFPAVAKAALADDLADDSFGERLLGKLRGLISLRRVGDVEGDSVEAKLARAEAALEAGDLAKAAAQVKSLPPQTNKATAAWLTRAEAHLAAERAIQQLAGHAVILLGTAR
ncbi:MAG: uroporphyrinogen-III synthase [Reyranellaceae bacterium]